MNMNQSKQETHLKLACRCSFPCYLCDPLPKYAPLLSRSFLAPSPRCPPWEKKLLQLASPSRAPRTPFLFPPFSPLSPPFFRSLLFLSSLASLYLPYCSSAQQAWRPWPPAWSAHVSLPCLWSCSPCRKGSPPLLTKFYPRILLEMPPCFNL